MRTGKKLKDVLVYTTSAEEWMKKTIGVSDFYYALKRFDEETFIHSEDVARLAVMLGKQQSYSDEQLVNLAIAGYLHDVGKIFTGINIIGKPDHLSSEEYTIVKEHPMVGYRHLESFVDNAEVLLGILEHHERLDGSGYPNGLEEDVISDFGKIIAVADVFSAMTAVRPYKQAKSCQETLTFMINSGEFDQELINALMNMYLSGRVICMG